jgi:hypothetical protein
VCSGNRGALISAPGGRAIRRSPIGKRDPRNNGQGRFCSCSLASRFVHAPGVGSGRADVVARQTHDVDVTTCAYASCTCRRRRCVRKPTGSRVACRHVFRKTRSRSPAPPYFCGAGTGAHATAREFKPHPFTKETTRVGHTYRTRFTCVLAAGPSLGDAPGLGLAHLYPNRRCADAVAAAQCKRPIWFAPVSYGARASVKLQTIGDSCSYSCFFFFVFFFVFILVIWKRILVVRVCSELRSPSIALLIIVYWLLSQYRESRRDHVYSVSRPFPVYPLTKSTISRAVCSSLKEYFVWLTL